jgi:hypothetical protein
MDTSFNILEFSEHLFWDVDRSKLDFSANKEQIVYQVVEFGLMKDWVLLQRIFNHEELKQIVVNLRQLDPVTLAYLAHFFKLDKSAFRCFSQSQSNQDFWNS